MSNVQDTETIIATINDTIDGFNGIVAKHEATSYEIIFESGSLGFMTNIDWYKKTYPLQYSFDFHTTTGTILNNTNTGTWELNFSTHDTVSQVLTVPANSGIRYFSFPQNIQSRWYKITSQVE
jgi:hypothetical protein